MRNKKAAKSFLGWKGINFSMPPANFVTEKCRVSVIIVYVPIEQTDGGSIDSNEFHLQQKEQIERDRWDPSLGKSGIGKENSNDYRLLQFCRSYYPFNTIQKVFGHEIDHRLKCYSNDGKRANLIDYLITNRKLAGSIKNARVYRGCYY